MSSAEQFQTKVEAFLEACESLQERGLWEEEEYGNVQAYYVNDLVCIIARIIAADGEITERETEFLGEVFGFDYTVEELEEVYEICIDSIKDMFETGVNEAYQLLKDMDMDLADSYKELILLAGQVAMDSDDMIMSSAAEKEELRKLCELLGE